MRTFYAIVLLAFVGLVILGCSESTDQLVAPVDKTSTTSLEKQILHSVTGNANIWIGGKMGTFTINAHQYADGTVDGVWNSVTTVGNPSKDAKLHLKVVALIFYPDFTDGSAVVIWGQVVRPDYAKDYYVVSFVVDNGEGANATGPDMAGGILGFYESIDMNITPEDIITALPDWYVPIDVGNVVIH